MFIPRLVSLGITLILYKLDQQCVEKTPPSDFSIEKAGDNQQDESTVPS